jgi:hypothetical protein
MLFVPEASKLYRGAFARVLFGLDVRTSMGLRYVASCFSSVASLAKSGAIAFIVKFSGRCRGSNSAGISTC